MKPPFRCLWCDEMVVPGDLMHACLPGYHYACALRTVLGPIAQFQDACSCRAEQGTAEQASTATCPLHVPLDPPELTRRQAAKLVADYVRYQYAPTPGKN